MSGPITTEGFVLRIVPYQDGDLILTVFTDVLGKVAVFAKGARRPRSRFGPEIDLLSRSEFVLIPSQNIKPLREATLKSYYPILKADYDHLTSALKAARLLSHLVREGQRDVRSLGLFAAFLDALNQAEVPLPLYELAFRLRLLDVFGVAPRLNQCARCGGSVAPGRFSPRRGGMVCRNCAQDGDLSVSASISHSLQALRTMEWGKLERLRLTPEQIGLSHALLERFMAYHIEGIPARRKGAKS